MQNETSKIYTNLLERRKDRVIITTIKVKKMNCLVNCLVNKYFKYSVITVLKTIIPRLMQLQMRLMI